MGVYDYEKYVSHAGVEYFVLEILGDDFLLVAKREEVESSQFPVKPLVIPREDLK